MQESKKRTRKKKESLKKRQYLRTKTDINHNSTVKLKKIKEKVSVRRMLVSAKKTLSFQKN